jgi:DnaJ-class molecular chaperone
MTPEASALAWVIGRVRECNAEIERLRLLVAGRSICGACAGGGKTQYWHAADDVEDVTCEDCKGRGVLQSKAPKKG